MAVSFLFSQIILFNDRLRWPEGIPLLLPDENQISSSEPISDTCKNLIARNGIDTSGPEFDKPTLGNHCPFLINIRVWNVRGNALAAARPQYPHFHFSPDIFVVALERLGSAVSLPESRNALHGGDGGRDRRNVGDLVLNGRLADV